MPAPFVMCLLPVRPGSGKGAGVCVAHRPPHTPRTHRSLPMRSLAMFSLLSLFAARATADFPAPKDLPSHPELPDPLVMLDGTKVTTKEQWVEKRRPELKALFQHYMYGTIPPARTVSAKVLHEDSKACGGKATLREVALSALPGHEFRLLVVVP